MEDKIKDLEELRAAFKLGISRYEELVNDWWDRLDDEQKLFAAYKITSFYRQAMKDRGTYRYLIYDIMGFSEESYAPLMIAGALDINNAFYKAEQYEKKNNE